MKGKKPPRGQFHAMAQNIARHEGKRVEVNIAQINEVLKLALREIAWELEWAPYDTMAWLRRYLGK